MLVNSKDILIEAKKAYNGVPAPDFIDLDSARSFVEVAEERKRPVILSYAQAFGNFLPIEEAALIGRYFAEKASVPVVLHFDHGMDEETVYRAIELGFTSVMLDASADPFEKNVSRTGKVVEYAHKKNVTVEAEIGHVGTGSSYQDYEHSDSVYTTVEEAVSFEKQTGVDSLAVSIGTAHGLYKNAHPVLNFDRLKELRQAVNVPLVLHGSSGTGDDNLRRCVEEGITKVNVYTEFLVSGMRAISEAQPKDYIALKAVVNEGMKNALRHCYDVYGERK
jgi:ketose-bisphosphate aldolase